MHLPANLSRTFQSGSTLLMLTPIAFICALTSNLGAGAQGLRVETKEQIINKRQFGWERPLTQKDPNLSHWHWEPINDSYKRIQTRTIYDKNNKALVLKEPQSSMRTSKQARTASDLDGKIFKQNHPQSVATPPVVFSYGHGYNNTNAIGTLLRTGASPHNAGQQQTVTRVAGKLVRSKNSNI